MNMKRLTLLALALVFLISAVSCASVRILGTWKDPSGLGGYTFETDGKGEYVLAGLSYPMEYKIDGNKLTITTRILGIGADKVYYFTLDGDTLTLKDNEQDTSPAVVLTRG